MSAVLEFLVKTRAYFNDQPLFGIGVLFLVGFVGGRLARRVRLPSICGYIAAGILCGPYVTKLVSESIVDELEPISHVALGLIALSIGGSFTFRKLRILGRSVMIITVVQILVTFFAVLLAMLALGVAKEVSILLAAIATATAPAATVAVVKEYRSKGRMTDTLLATVALDDVGCIILFCLAVATAGFLTRGISGAGLLKDLMIPVHYVVTSSIIGAVSGYIAHRLVVNRRNNNEIVVIILGFICFLTAVTAKLGLSPLLSNMLLGFTMVTFASRNERVLNVIAPVEAPIYSMFFAIAGTELQIGVLKTVGLVGIVFTLARSLGKYFGVGLGGIMTRSPRSITRYLGLCLLPQAGVGVGLMMLALNVEGLSPESKHAIRTIVLSSVFVSELLGPALTKVAIFKAGEARKGVLAAEDGE